MPSCGFNGEISMVRFMPSGGFNGEIFMPSGGSKVRFLCGFCVSYLLLCLQVDSMVRFF
jgi:hypothetical protein